MATAVLLGATGLVGRACLQAILDQGAYGEVRAIVRRPLEISHPALRQSRVDFARLEDHSDLFRADSVFCCLGTTIKKAGSQEAFRQVDYEYPLVAARLAVSAGAGRFLNVSALGANNRSRIFYNRVKGELEGELRKMNFPELHIFRPSLLLGEREEFRFGEVIAAPFLKFAGKFLAGSLRKYRPIEATTVARAMVAVSLSSASSAGGSARITRTEVYESDQIEQIGREESPNRRRMTAS